MMFQETIKEYESLSGLFASQSVSTYKPYNYNHTASIWFTKVLPATDYPDYQFPTTYNSGDTYADSVMSRVARRYWNRIVLIFDDRDDEASKAYKRFVFLQRVFNRLEETHDYYVKMLTLYASQADHLLDQIKTSTDSLNKFNDTPQDQSSTADDITDTTHLTNITKNEVLTKSDGASPIARLKEVELAYSDMLTKWADEFSDLFYNIAVLQRED